MSNAKAVRLAVEAFDALSRVRALSEAESLNLEYLLKCEAQPKRRAKPSPAVTTNPGWGDYNANRAG
jgi:hypothetical protein